jgi:deoxyadenosine/deoxycytidine kinase
VGEKGVNLLSLYYQDPSRWGFTFQVYAFMSRLAKWTDYSRLGSGIKISERSLLSDRYIFASIMRDLSLLDESEHAIYTQLYDHLTRTSRIADLAGIFYVYCPPETCLQRIKQRSREGEEAIPADYLARIHQKHEEWLNPPQKLEKVLVLDNSVPIDRQKIVELVTEWLALRQESP